MEYAKDEVFSIKYNKNEDKLEYPKLHPWITKMKKNKFLTLLVTLGGIFSTMNLILIYYFFSLLNNL